MANNEITGPNYKPIRGI